MFPTTQLGYFSLDSKEGLLGSCSGTTMFPQFPTYASSKYYVRYVTLSLKVLIDAPNSKKKRSNHNWEALHPQQVKGQDASLDI